MKLEDESDFKRCIVRQKKKLGRLKKISVQQNCKNTVFLINLKHRSNRLMVRNYNYKYAAYALLYPLFLKTRSIQ